MTKTLFTIIIILSSLCYSFAQEGEILYRNKIEPNVIMVNGVDHLEFDFDDDGEQDFIMTWQIYKKVHFFAWTYINHYYWLCTGRLNLGDTIAAASESEWHYPDLPEYGEGISFVPGFSDNDIICGFKKTSSYFDSVSYYGWVRFSLNGGDYVQDNYHGYADYWNSTCTIHDYAFCTIPDYPLRAGQTCFDWGINATEGEPNVTIQPNPTDGLIVVKGNDLQQIEVFNITGQRIASINKTSPNAILNLNQQPAGLYFISVTDSKGNHSVNKVVKH